MQPPACRIGRRCCARSRWTLSDPAVRAHAQSRAALEHELRDAVRTGAVDVVFQPVMALGTGRAGDNRVDDRIVGAQALPRWIRADDSEIEPERFVPLADE